MNDNRDLEQDYLRRLREAQERGDTRHVPYIDESRVRQGKLLTVKEITSQVKRFLTREGLGATEEV